MDLKLGVTRHRKNRTPNASGRCNENAYLNGFFMSLAFARGRRPKGKEKGVMGTKEARGCARKEGGERVLRSLLPRARSRAQTSFPFPFERLPHRQFCHRFYTFFLELLFSGGANSKREIFNTD